MTTTKTPTTMTNNQMKSSLWDVMNDLASRGNLSYLEIEIYIDLSQAWSKLGDLNRIRNSNVLGDMVEP